MISDETVVAKGMGVRDVVAISQFELLTDAAKVMSEYSVGSLVVVTDDDNQTMVGILTERDILEWVSRASTTMLSQRVVDAMTKDVLSCQCDEPITTGWTIMQNNGIRHLPIVKNGIAIGMLSVRDILSYLVNMLSVRDILSHIE
jgi:CBS domain-containing protein